MKTTRQNMNAVKIATGKLAPLENMLVLFHKSDSYNHPVSAQGLSQIFYVQVKLPSLKSCRWTITWILI